MLMPILFGEGGGGEQTECIIICEIWMRRIERIHSRDQRPYLFLETKESVLKKSSTPTGLIWFTSMADFSLSRYVNMGDVMSCAYAL